MNKQNTTKTFVIALAMMFALAIMPTIAFGQDKIDDETSKVIMADSENALEGVWQAVVTFRDCQTGAPHGSIQTLRTIAAGGTMSETNPSFPGSGHGIWNRTAGRLFSVGLAFYAYNAKGEFAGNASIKEYIKLNRNYDSYTSVSTFRFFDPNGNVVDSGCSTETATRLTF